jgi:acetyltransferase
VVNILRDGEVPCYDFPGTAARALVALTRYGEIRSREIGEVRQFDDVQRDRATDVLQKAKAEGREFLSAAEVYQLLSAYGIPVADWGVASSIEDAAEAAAQIGFPVVVKADSDSIVHKSDVGGVAVNLKDKDAVRSAAEVMGEKLGTEGLRFFVQKYCPGGMEIIVGAKAEGELGHLIMFGIGGIHVEQLKDVVFKLSPITTVEAREMLNSIKAAPLLDGVRGAAGVDKEGIVEVIGRLSQLVTDLPMIQEMDLNPIVAYEHGVYVVDARVGL